MENFKFGEKQEQWLQSLENNPERQLKRQLGIKHNMYSDDYQACCLGELCIITGKAEFNKIGILESGYSTDFVEEFKELGLNSADGGSSIPSLYSLAYLNDNEMTWPEIAAHVRKYGKYYFNKSY